MTLLRCARVAPGLRETERTAVVTDAYGIPDYLRVEQGFLSVRGGVHFLPVSLIDRSNGLVLLEYPQESERGNNRAWVRADALLADSPGVSA